MKTDTMMNGGMNGGSRGFRQRILPTDGVRAKLSKIRKGVPALLTQAMDRVDLELLECNLSPIDKYIVASGIVNKSGLFDPNYEGWRVKRIHKILEIYGVDFFKGKRILELGAGHGDIGAFFADLGATVLCLDGRHQNVNFAKLKHRKLPNIRFEQFNLENDFSSFGKFDLLINFGLVYHLENVDAHMKTCFGIAEDMLFETVVCDSTDPYKNLLRPGRPEVDEEGLAGVGSRPSPFYIERIATECGFEIKRYFTADLNYPPQFCYDWEHRNDNAPNDDFVNRRFWRFIRTTP